MNKLSYESIKPLLIEICKQGHVEEGLIRVNLSCEKYLTDIKYKIIDYENYMNQPCQYILIDDTRILSMFHLGNEFIDSLPSIIYGQSMNEQKIFIENIQSPDADECCGFVHTERCVTYSAKFAIRVLSLIEKLNMRIDVVKITL